MDDSVFEQITSALTVKSLCSSLGADIPAGSAIEDLEVLLPDADVAMNYPSRIVDSNGDAKGILWFANWGFLEMDEGPSIVDEVMDQLEPHQLLSSNTTILNAVEYFGKRQNDYFYVIDLNEVIGVLFYSDLFKPLGRLAFLALALELEDQALRLCQSESINERCWLSISENRKRKAIDLFKSRYKREPSVNGAAKDGTWIRLLQLKRNISDIGLLIECTNLVDKATMIWKQKLVTPATQADVLGFFNDLKEVRDQCAHPGGEAELLPKDRLAHFVQSAKHMQNSLHQSMRTHAVSEKGGPHSAF
jgi:hypothetical protein